MKKCANFIKVVGLQINGFSDTKIVFDGFAFSMAEADKMIKDFCEKNTFFIRIPCSFTYET